jgi:hypothetical protein
MAMKKKFSREDKKKAKAIAKAKDQRKTRGHN